MQNEEMCEKIINKLSKTVNGIFYIFDLTKKQMIYLKANENLFDEVFDIQKYKECIHPDDYEVVSNMNKKIINKDYSDTVTYQIRIKSKFGYRWFRINEDIFELDE